MLIENFNVSTGDDCVSIKAGWIAAYHVPTQNVTIRNLNCSTQSACVAIGSEMSGGVSGESASDCAYLYSYNYRIMALHLYRVNNSIADVNIKGVTCNIAGQGMDPSYYVKKKKYAQVSKRHTPISHVCSCKQAYS